ncbi:transglutaminase family protein [Spirochaetota bacterium]
MKQILKIYIYPIVLIQFFIINSNSWGNPIYSVSINNFSYTIFRNSTSRYRLYSSDINFKVIKTAFQKILRVKNSQGKSIIEIKNGAEKKTKVKPHRKDLDDTPYLNLGRREIKKLAEKFKHSRTPVKSIRRFVYKYISKKITGIPLSPAINIIKTKMGDCTEHAILTMAIMRSIGIPCRAVVGITLARKFQGMKNVFVYHMWVEAYYKKRWYLVDSTKSGKVYPNRYIAFALHSLKTEMPLSYLKAISAIQNLKIRYIGQK